MTEHLTGDSQEPEVVLEERRRIMADYTAGLLSEDQAAEKLDDLQTSNPTVNAAYDRNIREQGSID